MKKEGRRESEKKKSRLLRAFKPQNEILLPAHAQVRKLYNICIWRRRPRSVQPVNGFMVSLALYSTTVTRKPLDKLQTAFFGKISNGEWVTQSTKFFEKIHFQYKTTKSGHQM